MVAFEDLEAIPAGSEITAVELEVRMNRTRAGSVSIGLHRVQADWGEAGSVAPGQQGSGGSAQSGDATWIHRFFSDQRWDNPGGDFDSSALTETSVAGTATYTFPSTPEFVALVQGWLDDPATNQGLILVAEDTSGSSAKRFSSREGASPPTLRVTFTEGAGEPAFVINQGITGAWFNEATPGQGFLIEVDPEAEFLFLAWFTFEADQAKVGAPEHRWLTAQGGYSGDSAADLPLSLTSGGVFDASDMTNTETVGSMTLTFESCEQGAISYSLDEGLSGEIPITRVIPGTETLCQDLQENSP